MPSSTPASGVASTPSFTTNTLKPGPSVRLPSPWEERFRDGCAFVEGSHVAMSEARVPITDWGFTRSDATYDTLHVWRGRFFRPDAHLDRFCRNVGRLRLDSLPVDRAGIAAAMYGCVARTGLADAYVRLIATRGDTPLGPTGTRLRGHEFHYSTVGSEDAADRPFEAEDAVGNGLGALGQRVGRVLGSYLHLIDRA